jgi:MFS family permease
MKTTGTKLFYGWYIIAASALGICFGYVGTTVYAFSAFTLPMSEEFGWSRAAISLGITVSHVTMVIVAPILGMLIDRKGVKSMLLPSTAFFGAILASFYLLNSNIWFFYLGMVLLTTLGCGTSSVTYVRLLVTWFDKQKGMALALGISGAGVGALILPPLVTGIIARAGWRDAYLALGVVNLLVIVPLIYLVVRNSPADIDSSPDGVAPTEAESRSRNSIYHSGYTFLECIGKPAFWKLSIATLFLGVALTGTVSQLIPLLVDRGIARANAGNLASLLGLSVIASRLLSGYLLDRFHAPYVSACLLLAPVAGLVGLAIAPGEFTAIVTLIAIGVGLGLEFDALGYFCAQYFGRLTLGRTYGLLYVLFSMGGGAGAFVAGYSYDVSGSYTMALWGAAGITLVAVIMTVSLGAYPTLPERSSDASTA